MRVHHIMLALLSMVLGYQAVAVQGGAFLPGVAVTDNNPYPVKMQSPSRATSTPAGGTIASPNTYQSALAANTARKGCTIQNKSAAAMRVFVGAPGSATDAAAYDLAAGGTFSCSAGSLVVTDQISIAATTAGGAYVVVQQ